MRIAATICRYLLGLAFAFFGSNGRSMKSSIIVRAAFRPRGPSSPAAATSSTSIE